MRRSRGSSPHRVVTALATIVFAWSFPGPAAVATPGEPIWRTTFDGGGHDAAAAIAASPDGARVFVVGSASTDLATPDPAILVLSYDGSTGTELWRVIVQGAQDGAADAAVDVALSPDGARLFVTARVVDEAAGLRTDWITFAFDAASGTELWVRRRTGPYDDFPAALSMSPDGTRVYVTGIIRATRPSPYLDYDRGDYLTVAYDAITGDVAWQVHFGARDAYDAPVAIEAGPVGGRVYVTGTSDGRIVTHAYRAADGKRAWTDISFGPVRQDETYDLAVAPDGATVFVSGTSSYVPKRGSTEAEAVTLALRTDDGSRRWTARYRGPFARKRDHAAAIAVAPNGRHVVMAGWSYHSKYEEYFVYPLVFSYSVRTGRVRWSDVSQGSYGPLDESTTRDIVVGPAGTAYVAGGGLVAYGPNGTVRWSAPSPTMAYRFGYLGAALAGPRLFATAGTTWEDWTDAVDIMTDAFAIS